MASRTTMVAGALEECGCVGYRGGGRNGLERTRRQWAGVRRTACRLGSEDGGRWTANKGCNNNRSVQQQTVKGDWREERFLT